MLKRMIVFSITTSIVIFLNTFVYMIAYVPSDSMSNTIDSGDMVIGMRLFKELDRNDIIIFIDPEDENRYLVKRVIGLPGDLIEIKDGQVYANGQKLNSSFCKGKTKAFNQIMFCVPEETYFMLGDNRENSKDSRYWSEPYVYRNQVIAKVIIMP